MKKLLNKRVLELTPEKELTLWRIAGGIGFPLGFLIIVALLITVKVQWDYINLISGELGQTGSSAKFPPE